jgi:hypothetical protein
MRWIICLLTGLLLIGTAHAQENVVHMQPLVDFGGFFEALTVQVMQILRDNWGFVLTIFVAFLSLAIVQAFLTGVVKRGAWTPTDYDSMKKRGIEYEEWIEDATEEETKEHYRGDLERIFKDEIEETSKRDEGFRDWLRGFSRIRERKERFSSLDDDCEFEREYGHRRGEFRGGY